jgi:hypothetical protein
MAATMRSLSLDETRKWRGTDGQLGQEALDEVEPRAVLGSEGELEAAHGLLGEPGFGLPPIAHHATRPPA